jgi:pyruvate dehydrogenase E1 component alpha subunit
MSTMATPPGAKTSLAAKLPDRTLRKWLRDMLLIRELEVRSMQAYQNRKIGGFLHIYIGQEAVAVGAIAAARDEDPVITAYRDHGHALARGMDARYCMAELFGRIGGCAKGKGGSMHLFDRTKNFFGGHGIVGAQCPLGVGIAFATKYEDEVINGGTSGRVTLCFLGDGALNQGTFHESMNLAGVLDLPILFLCENNGYSMGTAVGRGTTMAHDLTRKADAYGMDKASIDGMDVMKVYDGLKPVIDRVRETSRPFFVELRTYRYKGHSMSDPRKYRTKEEEQEYEAADPIERLATYLRTRRGFAQEEYDAMTRDVRREVRDAIRWADESPAPEISELHTDVYTDAWGPYRGTSPPPMLEEETGRSRGPDAGGRSGPQTRRRKPGTQDEP